MMRILRVRIMSGLSRTCNGTPSRFISVTSLRPAIRFIRPRLMMMLVAPLIVWRLLHAACCQVLPLSLDLIGGQTLEVGDARLEPLNTLLLPVHILTWRLMLLFYEWCISRRVTFNRWISGVVHWVIELLLMRGCLSWDISSGVFWKIHVFGLIFS